MPKLVTEFLGRPLLAFADLSALDHHVMFVGANIDLEATEGKVAEVHTRFHAVVFRRYCLQALFFEVTAEKVDQRCSTSWLPQCGQAVFSTSCSEMVRVSVNVFLQALQTNS